MKITKKCAPSSETRQMLEALRQSVAKALERKRRLGQYWVTWQDGKPVLTGEDAPIANNECDRT